MSDGATDRNVTEKEIVYVKVLDRGYPSMKYLKIMDLKSAKAEGILKAIDDSFDGVYPNGEWASNAVDFGSDRAPVMASRINGVAGLVKQRVAWVVDVHCIAHELGQPVKDCFKNTFFKTTVETALSSVYYCYYNSPKRIRELEEIPDAVDESVQRPGCAHDTRWAAHKLKVLAKLKKNYQVVIL